MTTVREALSACARKVQYVSRLDAVRHAQSFERQNGHAKSGVHTHPYACGDHWHLTSMTKAEFRRARKRAASRLRDESQASNA